VKFRIDVMFGSTEDLSGDNELTHLRALDVGQCLLGQPTDEHDELFAQRNGVSEHHLVIYIVQMLVGGNGNLLGCATHPAGQPGAAIVQTNSRWLLAHEVGHVLGLRHVCQFPTAANPTPPTPCIVPSGQTDNLMFPLMSWTNLPPDISANEAALMAASEWSRPI
jgi:hypothetical protein